MQPSCMRTHQRIVVLAQGSSLTTMTSIWSPRVSCNTITFTSLRAFEEKHRCLGYACAIARRRRCPLRCVIGCEACVTKGRNLRQRHRRDMYGSHCERLNVLVGMDAASGAGYPKRKQSTSVLEFFTSTIYISAPNGQSD